MLESNQMLNTFFRVVTGAGYADILYLESLLYDMQINANELFRSLSEDDTVMESYEFNNIIDTLFRMALEECDALGDERVQYSIYCNGMDSHLYINDVECHSRNDILEELDKVYI